MEPARPKMNSTLGKKMAATRAVAAQHHRLDEMLFSITRAVAAQHHRLDEMLFIMQLQMHPMKVAHTESDNGRHSSCCTASQT